VEPEGSLLHSQVPATCPYPEPPRFSPNLHIPLPEIHLNSTLTSTPRSPKRSLSLRFRQQIPVYVSSLPYVLHARPSHSSPLEHQTNAAHNNNFVANLSDVASSSCDTLSGASVEYCRNSGSNDAAILSYKTHITASSLTVTCVYITATDRRSILRRWKTRMHNVSQSITSCYYPTWKHSHNSPAHCNLLEMLHVFSLSVAVELSVAATNRYTPVPPTVNPPAPRQTRPPHLLDHLPLWESVVKNGKFLLNETLEWSVEVALHVFSICAVVGEQRSFHFPIICTGAKEYHIGVWRPGWVIAAIWTVRGDLLAVVYGQGEACSTANIILKIGHGLLQTLVNYPSK
jgi:hypothetical protein